MGVAMAKKKVNEGVLKTVNRLFDDGEVYTGLEVKAKLKEIYG